MFPEATRALPIPLLQIKLTGELSTNNLSPGEVTPEYGVLVGPGVNAQNHQHNFCARIDPAVDCDQGGSGLVVAEVNAEVGGSNGSSCWTPRGVTPSQLAMVDVDR